MKKLLLALSGIALAAVMTVAPVKTVKAASEYVLTYQAQDLYNQAQRELDSARYERDQAQRRVDDLKNR